MTPLRKAVSTTCAPSAACTRCRAKARRFYVTGTDEEGRKVRRFIHATPLELCEDQTDARP